MGLPSSTGSVRQTLISLCILGVLVVIAATIIYRQVPPAERYESTQAGEPGYSPMTAATYQAGRMSTTDFSPLGPAVTYTAQNLYEKINGKAPLYTESGFIKLKTQQFVSDANDEVWMEMYLYDMGAVENAFSVYSTQKRAEGIPIESVNFGYRTANSLHAVIGSYYVEIVGSQSAPELLAGMVDLIDHIKKLNPSGQTQIPQLALFPQENLEPGSFKYYAGGAYGCQDLNRLFSARYTVGNETITAFFSGREEPADAQQTAAAYKDFMLQSGASEKTALNAELAGAVLDYYGTTEIVAVTGSYVVGVHQAENQTQAERLTLRLMESIENE